MNRSAWFVLLAVIAVAALFFTLDPLGFFGSGDDGSDGEVGEAGDLEGAGLKGRGKGEAELADLTEYEGDPVGALDLGLGPNTIKGMITGEEQPLYLARVRVVLPGNERGVRTRKDGTWEMKGLPDGQHTLRAAADGFLAKTVLAQPVGFTMVDGEKVEAAAVITLATIDLRRRPDQTDAIEVKVTDPMGRPIRGANVLATTMPWDIHLSMGPEMAGVKSVRHKAGVTDELGKARLGPLHPDKYNVAVSARGFATTGTNQVVVASGRTRHLSVQMLLAESISGKVVDSDNAPVAGAAVMGFAMPTFQPSLPATTGKDGSFVMDGLRRGNYMVIAWQEEGGSVLTNTKSPGSGVVLKLAGTGRVEGVATWADGTPVTNAQVRPYRAEPYGYVYSFTTKIENADGTFAVNLPTGTWQFRILADDGTLSEDGKAVVKVGETTKLEVVMPETGVVRGVVTHGDGEHVSGAEVYVKMGGFPPTKSREHYTRTDADGAFEVSGLGLGPVKLHVVHPKHCDTVLETEAKLASQAEEVTVRLTKGARIEGHVYDPDGNGIAGEQVNLFQTFWETRSTYVTYCDDRGYYAFDAISPGTYQMSTGPFEPGAAGLMKSGVVVSGEDPVTVDFETQGAGGTVTGAVYMNEKPVAGATISVTDDRGMRFIASAVTDENGRFSASGLRTGRVTVMVQTGGGLSTSKSATFAEGTTSLDVRIDMGSGTLRGRAVDAEGKPVSGAWAYVESVEEGDEIWTSIKAQMSVNQDGTFEAGGLSAGTYRVRVNSPGHAQYLSDPLLLQENESRDLGDLKLPQGTTLSGTVKDDAGVPVEDATVSLKDANGRPVFTFSLSTSGSDGKYYLQGMEPGSYTVRFEAAGYGPDEKAVTLDTQGATVDGTLTRGGAVDILVEDESGHPVQGAKLRLYDERGQAVRKTYSLVNLFDSDNSVTNEEGRASIADLAAGTYTVKITYEDWTQVTDPPRVYVSPGGNASARITLRAP